VKGGVVVMREHQEAPYFWVIRFRAARENESQRNEYVCCYRSVIGRYTL
jgi:hypothetical protein